MAFQKLGPLFALFSLCKASSDSKGVSVELQQKLHLASSFLCDNEKLRLELLRFNDNYCDCEDGSDEPGTSACSHTSAVFHCINTGYFSADIPTSYVNDGVCDCCDGSDEYASGASCASHCDEMMQSFLVEKKDLVEQMDKGLEDRVVLIAKAQELWDEEELKKQKLETLISSLQEAMKLLESRKSHEERLEQEEKEHLVAAQKQKILAQLGLLDLTKEQLALIILEIGRSGVQSTEHELLSIIRMQREMAVNGEEELSKTPMDEQDEAFRERDDAREKETQRIEALLEQRKKDMEERAQEEEEDEDEEEEMREKTKIAAEDGVIDGKSEAEADVAVEAETSMEEEEDLVLPEVETHPLGLLYDELAASERYERSEATLNRNRLETATQKLKEAETKLAATQMVMEKDYGVDNLFFGLRNMCVETNAGEYKYKICFFGAASQDNTKLGNMEEIKLPKDVSADEAIVKELKFTEGDKCWNGLKRSLTVTLECGPDPMELYDIEEPSTCVYTAKLRTPAACSEKDREQILTFNDARIAPHHIEFEVSPTL